MPQCKCHLSNVRIHMVYPMTKRHSFRTAFASIGSALLLVPLLGVLATPLFGQALLNPAALKEQAPASYKARFDTSKGVFVLDVRRDSAPNGADRFYNLVKNGFFDDARFFRVISDFMVQFGINGDPKVSAQWRTATIPDDPVKQSNKRGFITFATSGPNSRTSQVFINFGDNARLDQMGFAPFGQVTTGMNVVDQLYS